MIQKLTVMILHKWPYDNNSAIITILSQELEKLMDAVCYYI
nr:hypothetical protein [Spiroplasma kunkelii]